MPFWRKKKASQSVSIPDDVLIRVRDLHKVYRVGKTKLKALDGVDLDVKRGDFIAITGPSGSGKSTLLNLLAGLEPPSKGTIHIGGKKISGLSEEQLVSFRRRHVGFIFQSFNLIASMNCVENVALPLNFQGMSKRQRNKRAKDMLEMVGLSKRAKHRPSELSGGQQQRVGVARALVVNPDIIFADEPTGNLDSSTSREVLSMIKRISEEQNQTVIMVTHDLDLAQYANKIFIIVDGKLTRTLEGRYKDQLPPPMKDNLNQRIDNLNLKELLGPTYDQQVPKEESPESTSTPEPDSPEPDSESNSETNTSA